MERPLKLFLNSDLEIRWPQLAGSREKGFRRLSRCDGQGYWLSEKTGQRQMDESIMRLRF